MSLRIRVQTVIIIGSLSNDHGDANENSKKANRIRLTKQQLCKCITLFCTLFCRHFKPLHDYDVKLPNLTFDCGREHKSNDFLFLFVNFYSPLEVNS